jgi:Trk K+ transport system NAD-binding subunit
LPVIDNVNSKKLIGIIWRKDIQDAYDREIEKRELTSNLASLITMKEDEPMVHFMEGYSIIEIASPKIFVGKSIRELNIRSEYGVDVLSIKINDKGKEKINAIPSPDYVIKKEDTLIIAGEIKNINFVRNLG